MRTYLLLLSILALSCSNPSDAVHHPAGSNSSNEEPNLYRLHLDPVKGSRYSYTITNSSTLNMDVMGKKVDNESRSSVGVVYTVDKDSNGNFLLNTVYNKIAIYSKTGDKETDIDADKAETSGDPVEKLLGSIKTVPLVAVMSPRGELRSVRGYDEMKQKIMAGFLPDDVYARAAAEKQWDQRIKQGLIGKSMQQLFQQFPDSAIHVGDKWKSSSIQHDEVNMRVNSEYTLKDISDGIATIDCKGNLASDSSAGNNSMGYSYTADLKGTQKGEFRIETATGMLLSSKMTSNVTGEMTVSGTKVPVIIDTKVKLEGHKDK